MSILQILAFALILSQAHLDVSCKHAIVVVVCSTQGQEIFTSLMKYILDILEYWYKVDFTKTNLQTTPSKNYQPLGTLGHCSQKSSILRSPTLVWTVTDMLSLSETAPGHKGQPTRMEMVGWLQNTTQN